MYFVSELTNVNLDQFVFLIIRMNVGVFLSQKNRRKFVDSAKLFSFEKKSKDGGTEFYKCDVRGS